MVKTNYMYGFVDESGASGVANGDADYLVVSVALFKDEKEMRRVREKFVALRKELNLSPRYEFHFSHNKPRIRAEVFAVMAEMDFEFMTFAIKKNDAKKFASYARLSEMIVKELDVWRSEGINLRVMIDVNPALYKGLNKAKKQYSVKNMYFRQGDSADNDGLQLVDYVVSGHSKVIKGEKSFGFKETEGKLIALWVEGRN